MHQLDIVRRASCGGFITTGTLLSAAASAIVLMAGCRTAPDAGPALCRSMVAVQPFDEQFVVVADPDAP